MIDPISWEENGRSILAREPCRGMSCVQKAGKNRKAVDLVGKKNSSELCRPGRSKRMRKNVTKKRKGTKPSLQGELGLGGWAKEGIAVKEG